MGLGVEHHVLPMFVKQELVHLWPQTPKDDTQTGQGPVCTPSMVYRAWRSCAAHMHAHANEWDAAEINRCSLDIPAAPGLQLFSSLYSLSMNDTKKYNHYCVFGTKQSLN